MHLFSTVAATAALSLAAVGANASVVISRHIEFSNVTATSTADNFTHYGPVSGAFDITFDPSADAFNQTVGITLISLEHVYLDSTLSFSYDASADTLNVGGIQANDTTTTDPNLTQVLQTAPASNDFSLRIGNFTTAPILLNFALTLRPISYAGILWDSTVSDTGSVTVTDITPTVPLPSDLPLLAGALGALVVMGRRKRAA